MLSSWICVDASLVVRLVSDPNAGTLRQLWDQWIQQGQKVAAPSLLRYELTNALYRYQRHGMLNSVAVRRSLRAALALPIDLRSDASLHERAMDLAGRFQLPAAYDAHYLALAEQLGAALWTTDQRLVNSVQPALGWVHLAAV
jgi:predicted nucleic acid-binding protein